MIRYAFIARNNQPFYSISTSYSQEIFVCKDSPLEDRVILKKKSKIYYRFLKRRSFLHRFSSKWLTYFKSFLKKKDIAPLHPWISMYLKSYWTMQHNIMFLSVQINATILVVGQSYDYLIGVAVIILKILRCSGLNRINYKINTPE